MSKTEGRGVMPSSWDFVTSAPSVQFFSLAKNETPQSQVRSDYSGQTPPTK